MIKKEIQNKINQLEGFKGKTLENHPNCPVCGSENTSNKIDHGACLCNCDCWSHPQCNDCGYRGYTNSEGIYWHNSDQIKWLKSDLKRAK